MTVLLPLLAGTLPSGICYSSEQERLNGFAGNLWAQLNGASFFNYGDTVPAPEFNSFPWLRVQDMNFYMYQGAWIRPHEFVPGRHLWEEFLNEPAIWSFDGGDGTDPATNPPSSQSGAMWQLDPNYTGRGAMSPGIIPGSDPVKTLGYGENYGAGSFTILQTNLPALNLSFKAFIGDHSGGEGFPTVPHNTDSFNGSFDVDPRPLGDATPFSIVHPVRGMCCIVRTARIYRTVP